MTAFGRYFAALVGQVLDAPEEIEPQKLSLRFLREQSREAAHRVGLDGRGRVVANGEPLALSFPGVTALAAQMAGHELLSLDFAAGVSPAELLTVARLLAQPPAAERAGHSFATRLDGSAIVQVTPTLAVSAARTAPAAAAGMAAAPSLLDEADAMPLMFAAARAPTGSAEELLAQLRDTRDVNRKSRLLDEFCSFVEQAHNDQRAEQVVAALVAIVDEEEREQDKELKRAWTAAFRRLEKPTLFTLVATSMVQRRDRIAAAMRILVRAGSAGWEALLALLREAHGQHDRSIYADALQHHPPPAAVLVDALDDMRWHAVRNLCELVGEMRLLEAVPQLIVTLRHGDERVRMAAAVALAKLGTPDGIAALRAGLRDGHAAIRLLAAQAFAAMRTPEATRILLEALESEQDAATQAALLTLVGKSGTTVALAHLVKQAEPEVRLFGRRPTETRLAAIRAIGEMHTADAMQALRGFATDKDARIAEAATLTAKIVQRRTATLPAATLDAIKDL